MSWTNLIPLGASILGGIFGGDKTTENTPQNSPELDAAAQAIFARAMETFSKSYPQYQGDRVAGPTASRQALGNFMPQMQGAVSGGMDAAGRYSNKIDSLMRMTPQRISVPTLLGDSVQSTQQGGYYGGGGSGAGGDFSNFDAKQFLAQASPKGKFDMSRVAFDPGAK